MSDCNNIAMLLSKAHLYVISNISHIFTNCWHSCRFEYHIFDFINSRVFRFAPGDFFYSLTCWTLMRTVIFLPVALIKKADNEYWSRSLAYFVRLKSLYKNSTHYNFSLRSLAKHLKCCPATLSVHLKELEKRGLIRKHFGNMTFIGAEKLRIKYGKYCVGVPVDAKNQYDIIRAQIIRFNLSAQEYKIRKSGKQIQCNRYVPNTYLEKTSSCYAGLSAEGIGWLLGVSKSSGSRIRQKLADLGIIQVSRVFSKLFENVSLKHYNKLKYFGQVPIYAKYIENNVVIERRKGIVYNSYFGSVS